VSLPARSTLAYASPPATRLRRLLATGGEDLEAALVSTSTLTPAGKYPFEGEALSLGSMGMTPAEPDEEVQRLWTALGKAGVSRKCPACEREGVSLPFAHLILLPASNRFPEGCTTLAEICPGCGYVRLFAAAALDQYMDPRDAEN
jgi:hypothetical protein